MQIPRRLRAVGLAVLVVGCAPTTVPTVTPVTTAASPIASTATADRLANAAQLLALLPSGAGLVLAADSSGNRPGGAVYDLGRIGDTGTMAVVLACDGTGPLLLDVVSDAFIPYTALGLQMAECVPGGQLDVSRLAIDSPDDRIVITAPPATRWRIAIART